MDLAGSPLAANGSRCFPSVTLPASKASRDIKDLAKSIFRKVPQMAHPRADVIAAVEAAFPGRDAAEIVEQLDLYGTESYERERQRVQLAIVALSQGQEEKLLDLIQAAKRDYRDVLSWAATGPLSASQGEEARQAAARILARWGNKDRE